MQDNTSKSGVFFTFEKNEILFFGTVHSQKSEISFLYDET